MATATIAVLALAVAPGGGALAQDQVLKVAMGSPGEAAIRVWDDIKAQFEAAHPGVEVEMNYMPDDLYETIGLQQLLASGDADVYFEWTGSRMAQRAADGYAADLTEAVTTGPLAGLWDPSVFPVASVDGKVVLAPHTQDVSNVLWYNVPLLEQHGVTPPTTWDELLAACDTLVAADVIPIASGNKDLWAAGNWLSHMVSRVVGEANYDATLSGTGAFNTAEWQTAFGYIDQLRQHGCVNESANAITDNEGAQLFFQGAAAMHPIGSWLVSWAIDEAPDLEFDYVNLPAMPEGSAGDQGSVIGVETGYMVNAQGPNQELAIEYLALVNSAENVQKFIEAEVIPITLSAQSDDLDSRSARLSDLLNNAPAVVLPPDTGYNLEMAAALYGAEALVLGGQQSPADALAGLDQQLGRQ
jgi:raffinose/stachyose/melibiose transport system substrate-binding protein